MSPSVDSESVGLAYAPAPARVPADADAPSPPSALALLAVLRRHWRLLVLLPTVVAIAAGATRVMRPRTYASTATFIPQVSSSQRSAISGLAAQFGVSVGGSEPGQSPQFFSELVRSRTVLERVASTPLPDRPGGPPRPLADALAVPAGTPAERLEGTIEALLRMVAAGADMQTGVVRVRVVAPTPELARGITDRILSELNAFNLERRQQRAAGDRQFSEERLAELRAELAVAESRYSSFRRANRSVEGSPELQAQDDRLARDVQFRQQLYSSLAQAYEQARLDEVRATPVISVLDQPARPTRAEPRGAVTLAIIAWVAAFTFAAFAAFALDVMRPRRASAR